MADHTNTSIGTPFQHTPHKEYNKRHQIDAHKEGPSYNSNSNTEYLSVNHYRVSESFVALNNLFAHPATYHTNQQNYSHKL